MSNQENAKRDLLLVIISMLFIIFITGTEAQDGNSTDPIVIP